jgi:glycine/D-amino acid oxidase-like deaminating enzyme
MMQVDVLVVGQGICGTFLCRELDRAGLSFIVVDEDRGGGASRIAAGLINPVTGRRLVKTWMIDELLAGIPEAYGEPAGPKTGWRDGQWLRPARVVDFFPTPQMRLAFLKRVEEGGDYLALPADEGDWRGQFSYDFGYGWIDPCYLVDMQGFLAAERRQLVERGWLRAERFVREELSVGRGWVRYRDMEARWVIFCDGIGSSEGGFFERLPFAPNKGEALIVEIPGLALPEPRVFKKGMSLIPWREGLYWVGSSYEWSFTDAGPTAAFRENAEALLKGWLRMPFRVVEQLASVRPATLERRPFVGLHPLHPAVGILNGMGTKGCSLAPYFARQLVRLLVSGVPVQADADVGRFRRVLGWTG